MEYVNEYKEKFAKLIEIQKKIRYFYGRDAGDFRQY